MLLSFLNEYLFYNRDFARKKFMKTARKAGFMTKDTRKTSPKYILPTSPLARRNLTLGDMGDRDRPVNVSFEEDLAGMCLYVQYI